VYCQDDNVPPVAPENDDDHLGFDCTKLELLSDANSATVEFKGITAEATDKVTLFCSEKPEEVPCEMNGAKVTCTVAEAACAHPRVISVGDDELCGLKEKGKPGEHMATADGGDETFAAQGDETQGDETFAAQGDEIETFAAQGDEFEAAAIVETVQNSDSSSNTNTGLPVYAWVAIGLAVVAVVVVVVIAVVAIRFKKTTESV